MRSKVVSLISVLGILVTACGGSEGGSLEAIIDPEGEASGFTDFAVGSDKSFGIFVCANDGPVVIESVEPMGTEGDIEYLGAMVYTSSDRFVGAAHGFPPDGIEETRLIESTGVSIEADCENPDGEERIQLIVGAERTSPAGGVVDGLVVETDSGRVEIDYTILLCGDALEFCEVLIPPDE